MADRTILVIGTYDTKNDELSYMADKIVAQGGGVITMDVSVLGDPEIAWRCFKAQGRRRGGKNDRSR